jgi:4-hydroxybenzoate polyprenyltransferase
MYPVKRIVGAGLIVLAFLLCPAWATLIPESEPEIAVVALIAMLYLVTFGLLLISSATDAEHKRRQPRS